MKLKIGLQTFTAGFLSTLIFHQGLLALLFLKGMTQRRPFNMTATGPLHVPAVISLAFWGGIWGILIWMAIRSQRKGLQALLSIVLGAIGPSMVAWCVVMPLKGMPVAGGWSPEIVKGALLLNGVWGLGLWLIMRAFSRAQLRRAL